SRILRKIDLHILPWIFGLYAPQYLDKTALGYAAIMGIRDDTNINNSQYSWTGSIFYVGYLAFEYPHNMLMQKFPLAKYVSITVIFWGIVLCCHAGTKNFAGLMATRFFLGALEGSVTAGFVLITSRWYRSTEQAFRTAIWFCANGFAQIAGGALAYGITRGFGGNTSITFPSWKAIFLVCGLLTSVCGFGLLYFLPDSPITAKWLSQEERRLAVERLRANQQGIGSKVFKWYQVREAFTDIRTYLIFLFCVRCTIPCGGITVFFTQLIQGYGFSSEDTVLISMLGGVMQIITNLGLPLPI
ncbi:major facilitator superfamily domain-containing protein, partial [Thermoascus aurantiacus ATCC 26904]